jgi:AhpD family alkylhydroperoxidase
MAKIRASQINGCTVCLHMHSASARKLGETEERLYLLDAWRESPLYSERERAALAWAEALTRVSETHAPDDVYRALQAQFTEAEQVTLTSLIVTINGWNRIQVGFRAGRQAPGDLTTVKSSQDATDDGPGAPAGAGTRQLRDCRNDRS